MAFGTFYIEEKEKQQKKAPVRASAPVKRGRKAQCTMSILLIGRTGEGIRDYLCSMAINMDKAAGNAGLAFYTQDAQTIAGKIAAKKELESKLMEQDGSAAYEADAEYRAYSYILSQAGRQSTAVELAIDGVTVKGLRENMVPEKTYDVIWLLTDFPATEADRAREYQDVDQWLGQHAAAEGGVPCFVIMGCLEHLGGSSRITSEKTEIRYPESVRRLAEERCRQVYPGLQGSGAWAARLFLVQIYGGFAFSHWTEDGRMALQAGKGTFGSYLPAGCHGPLYEVFEWARNNEKKEFFRLPEGRELGECVKTAFIQAEGNVPESIVLKTTDREDSQEERAHETEA